MQIRKVSQSEFKLFRRCQRSWWLAYQARLVPRTLKSNALTLGILTHLGLEVMYDTNNLEHARQTVKQAALDAIEDDTVGTDAEKSEYIEIASTAQIYLEGYWNWVVETGADQRYETVALEQELEMPLCVIDNVQWVFIGKLDRVVFDRSSQQRRFIDFKTTQSFVPLIENALRNEQFPGYEMLLRHNNLDPVGGGIWRMILKRKRAKDGDGEFFRDYECSYNDHVVEALKRRYVQLAHDMQHVQVVAEDLDAMRRRVVPTPTYSCSWDCGFAPICDMFDDGSRVDHAIVNLYATGDPYARYAELKEGL